MSPLPLTVLVMEKDRALALEIESLLEPGDGPEPSAALSRIHRLESPEDVYRHLGQGTADVLLTGSSLPREFCDRLADQQPAVPVIVIGDGPDMSLVSRVLAAGAQDYLERSTLDRPRLIRSIQYARHRIGAVAALREREQRVQRVLEGAVDGIWEWDPGTGRIRICPRGRSRLLGDTEALWIDAECWLERIHPDDREGFRHVFEAGAQASGKRWRHELRLRHAGGEYRWIECQGVVTAPRISGGPGNLVGSMTDITGRKKSEERILHAVYHDALTGLPNRASFMRCLGQILARCARRPDHRFAILFLDLDRFKPINDRHGHLVGDRFLTAVAGRLESCVRPGDMVARLAGDEFTVLVDDIQDESDAYRVAERIHQALQLPMVIDGLTLTARASIGVSLNDGTLRSADELLGEADAAMYRVKRQGCRGSSGAGNERHDQARQRLALETDLARALEAGQFVIQFQPIVSVDDEAVAGFEALLRWRHPTRGLLGPKEFLQIAESLGLMVPIGHWMLRESLGWLRRYRTSHLLHEDVAVSVNLSRRQIDDPGLGEVIEGILRDLRLPGHCLKLEVSADSVRDLATPVVESLRGLSMLGVQLFIDDFGTGSLSLERLDELPVETFKIDRSLVNGLGIKDGCTRIVRAILGLARNLGIGVIAEGVENAAQRAQLSAWNCPHAQGMFFFQPLDHEDAGALLRRPPGLAPVTPVDPPLLSVAAL